MYLRKYGLLDLYIYPKITHVETQYENHEKEGLHIKSVTRTKEPVHLYER